MKRISFLLIGFVSLFLLSVPLFGQSKSIETFLVDSFDGAQTVNAPGHPEHGKAYSWAVQGSKFMTEGYPNTHYFHASPNALKSTRPARAVDAPAAQVFGVQVAFNRKADNWFEIYPLDTATSKPYALPLFTTVQSLDFWVWGANYNYTLEVLVRDVGGVVHVLPAGSLKFNGWKNVVINIPAKVQQKARARSVEDTLRLVGFRVRTSPQELVDNFIIFFDQIKYTCTRIGNIYDGYDLRNADFGEGAGQ
jgi:hypothetical protein